MTILLSPNLKKKKKSQQESPQFVVSRIINNLLSKVYRRDNGFTTWKTPSTPRVTTLPRINGTSWPCTRIAELLDTAATAPPPCITANPCNEVERVRPALDARLRVLYGPKYRELGKEHASKRSQCGVTGVESSWEEIEQLLGSDHRSFLAGDSSSIVRTSDISKITTKTLPVVAKYVRGYVERRNDFYSILTDYDEFKVKYLKRYYLNVIKENKIMKMIFFYYFEMIMPFYLIIYFNIYCLKKKKVKQVMNNTPQHVSSTAIPSTSRFIE